MPHTNVIVICSDTFRYDHLGFLGLQDRRWVALVGLGTVALLGAAALGLPIAGRLFTPVDPVWMQIIAARSPDPDHRWLDWRVVDWVTSHDLKRDHHQLPMTPMSGP